VHGEGDAGVAFGFIAHRWEFGYETADVIAEFAECLQGESVRFEQITEDPLHVRAWRGEQVSWQRRMQHAACSRFRPAGIGTPS
jgi:hypothetical protein